jgi:Protein of unknown function (DUF3137)
MKSTEDFKVFYEAELKHHLRKVEGRRRALVTKILIVAVLSVVIAISGSVFYWNHNVQLPENERWNYGWLVLGVLVVFVGGFVLMAEMSRNRSFYDRFKMLCIEEIMKFIHPSFHYKAHKFVPINRFVESHMFKYLPNKRYEGDDFCSGTLGSLGKLEFSEIEARRKPAQGEKIRKKDEGLMVFKGLYFVAEVENTFPGYTVIVPKSNDLTKSQFPDNVKLHPYTNNVPTELSQYFSVFTDMDSTSKDVLTPNVVKLMVEFQRTHAHTELMASFHNHKIYVGVAHEKDLFEPKLFHSLMDFNVIKTFFDDLYNAIMIVETLGQARTEHARRVTI